ncbi:MAG TPA: hypothetical protein PLN81_09375 [Bacillota bacterium]|jgi:hypothetical protein|nr:hypothetical protein [Bacillota bacterium]
MCVLAVAAERKLTAEEVRNCFAANGDGAGVAWSRNGKNHFRKGFMDLGSFLAFYEQLEVLPHIVHFRVATSGGVRRELTHPFIVSLASPLVLEWSGEEPLLAHNGVVADWQNTFLNFVPEIIRELRRRKQGRALPPGPWSDTRAAAVMVALAGDAVLPLLGGKWALLDSGKVQLYGDFVQERGVYFSNMTYKYGSRRSASFFSPSLLAGSDKWSDLFDEEGDAYDAGTDGPDPVAPAQEDSRKHRWMPRRNPRVD